jgi:hypothetical protein
VTWEGENDAKGDSGGILANGSLEEKKWGNGRNQVSRL